MPIEAQAVWAQSLGLDPTQFARTLLRYYEPELHRLLFDGAADDVEAFVADRAAQA